MKEIFKDIPNYEGLYQVSNFGRVKSLRRISPYKRIVKEKFLSPTLVGRGVLGVTLYFNGKRKCYHVHQLVAMAFLNNKPCGMKIVVDHIDNNPLNNNVSNLQLTSQRINASKDRKGGTSKYVGVFWCNTHKYWVAKIVINRKQIHLGTFKCELSAAKTYNDALNSI